MISFMCATMAIPLLLLAATTDLALRMVPNFVCLALAIDGVIGRGFSCALPTSLLAMLCVFVPAIVCWRHGLMGGGDAKLLAAVSLLVPANAVLLLVLAIALSGGIIGLFYWTMKLFVGSPKTASRRRAFYRILQIERHRIRRGFSIPYAMAITSGTLFVLGCELAT